MVVDMSFTVGQARTISQSRIDSYFRHTHIFSSLLTIVFLKNNKYHVTNKINNGKEEQRLVGGSMACMSEYQCSIGRSVGLETTQAVECNLSSSHFSSRLCLCTLTGQ